MYLDKTNLGSESSRHLARGLLKMPDLKAIDLYFSSLDNEFYRTMAVEGATSRYDHDCYAVQWSISVGGALIWGLVAFYVVLSYVLHFYFIT